MFEDVNNQGKQVTPGGSAEPIDIFSEADASAPVTGEIMEEGVKAGFPVKIIALIVGVFVVVIVGGLGIYQFVLKKPASLPVEEALNKEQPTDEQTDTGDATNEEQPVDQSANTVTSSPVQDGQAVTPPADQSALPTPPVNSANMAPSTDSDGDGLTDQDELKYGTDKNVVDTDNDGLSDREEIQVYTTNPLNPDTDNDGFSDSTEVKGGYNPNGPGKLVTIPSEQPAAPSATPTPVQP